MLKKLLRGERGAADDAGRGAGAPARSDSELEQLALLTEFFPVGKKLRYTPEFQKEIVLDTLIVAYVVNGQYVYSWEGIELDAHGKTRAFRVGERGERVGLEAVRQFQLLVPDTSHLEMTLDYHRRAMIGRSGQFGRGNVITLVSNAGARGVSTVDTEVAKLFELKDGPYAQTRMVLLTPELHTLAVTDQRHKARARTCVPVHMSASGELLRGPCTIIDVSDTAVRVRVRDGETMPPLRAGESVVLEFDLGESGHGYTIAGAVIRRSSEACVVRLEGLRREGRFVAFGPLDTLELKAGLLNYGK